MTARSSDAPPRSDHARAALVLNTARALAAQGRPRRRLHQPQTPRAMWRDPERSVGSQSEVPRVTVDARGVRVRGYQSYDLWQDSKRTLVVHRKPRKFELIETVLGRLHSQGTRSFVDIGCNAGLVSVIAHRVGFAPVLCLDHDPEYVDAARDVAAAALLRSFDAKVFSFGQPVPMRADVVFCGAILHWIFCLTATFATHGFRGILGYLLRYASSHLLVEWIDPADGAVRTFGHLRRCGINASRAYSRAAFEAAVSVLPLRITETIVVDGPHRVLYVMRVEGARRARGRRLLRRDALQRARLLSRQRPGCDGVAWITEDTRIERRCSPAGHAIVHGACNTQTRQLALSRTPCASDTIAVAFDGGELRSFAPSLTRSMSQSATAVVWFDGIAKPTVALKRQVRFGAWGTVQREAHVLQRLARFPWAPRLLCYGNDTLLTEYVGERVSTTSRPPDARAQMRRIVDDLRTVDVRHNDIVTPYRVDVMVDARQRLHLIDFGWASTLSGDFSFNMSGVPARVPCARIVPDEAAVESLVPRRLV